MDTFLLILGYALILSSIAIIIWFIKQTSKDKHEQTTLNHSYTIIDKYLVEKYGEENDICVQDVIIEKQQNTEDYSPAAVYHMYSRSSESFSLTITVRGNEITDIKETIEEKEE